MDLLQYADENDMAVLRQFDVDDPKKFIEMSELRVPTEDWAKIIDGVHLNSTYVEYFVNLILLQGLSCVLKSNGYYCNKKKKNFVIRFECSQIGCERKYTLKQKDNSSDFVIHRNCVPMSHKYQMTRALRGPQRDIARSYLVNHLPSDYSALASSSLNVKLYSEGNLQNVVSDTTLRKIREEAENYRKSGI